MVRHKRKSGRINVKRYVLKNDPFIQAKQINACIEIGREFLAFWLAFLDIIEVSTLEILNNYGISGEDIKKFFAYAKKLVKSGKITNFLTILIEYQNVLDWTLKRNENYVDYLDILKQIENKVSITIGEYIHLWFGFYDLAYYDISVYLE
jgi:hypothetical protein